MQTLAQMKQLLAERGLSPRKALGQNFLIEQTLVGKLVDAAGVNAGDVVLEIGPGTGTLTETLLARGCSVIACELDRGLAAMLRERAPTLEGGERLTIVEGDCLGPGRRLAPEIEAALGPAARTGFALVANLPYGAATPVMLSLLIDFPACRRLAVTIQREVADRLMAKPGTKDYGTLGIVAQATAKVRLVAIAPPECFWPRPEVTSAMVLLERLQTPLTTDARGLAAFSQRVFSKRRKQLGSTLGRDGPWPAGVTPTMRPEELGVGAMVELAALHAPSDPAPPSGESPSADGAGTSDAQ